MPSELPSKSRNPHQLRTELEELKREQRRTNEMLSRLLEETEPEPESPQPDPPAGPESSQPTDPPNATPVNHREPEWVEPRPAPTPEEQLEEQLQQEQQTELREQEEARAADESTPKKRLAGRWW